MKQKIRKGSLIVYAFVALSINAYSQTEQTTGSEVSIEQPAVNPAPDNNSNEEEIYSKESLDELGASLQMTSEIGRGLYGVTSGGGGANDPNGIFDPPPDVIDTPLDNWLILLVLAGALYGLRRRMIPKAVR